MKIHSMFHVLIFIMTFLLLSMPIITLAQINSEQAEAVAAAEADAEADTNQTFWFIVGCFGSLLGLLYANYDAPTAPRFTPSWKITRICCVLLGCLCNKSQTTSNRTSCKRLCCKCCNTSSLWLFIYIYICSYSGYLLRYSLKLSWFLNPTDSLHKIVSSFNK